MMGGLLLPYVAFGKRPPPAEEQAPALEVPAYPR
jgi:hypothetical protein